MAYGAVDLGRDVREFVTLYRGSVDGTIFVFIFAAMIASASVDILISKRRN